MASVFCIDPDGITKACTTNVLITMAITRANSTRNGSSLTRDRRGCSARVARHRRSQPLDALPCLPGPRPGPARPRGHLARRLASATLTGAADRLLGRGDLATLADPGSFSAQRAEVVQLRATDPP